MPDADGEADVRISIAANRGARHAALDTPGVSDTRGLRDTGRRCQLWRAMERVPAAVCRRSGEGSWRSNVRAAHRRLPAVAALVRKDRTLRWRPRARS